MHVAYKCLSGTIEERSVPILSCGTAMDRGGVIHGNNHLVEFEEFLKNIVHSQRII